MNTCLYQTPPFDYRDYDTTYLGMDRAHGDVEIYRCKKCGLAWLNYLIEEGEPYEIRSLVARTTKKKYTGKEGGNILKNRKTVSLVDLTLAMLGN